MQSTYLQRRSLLSLALGTLAVTLPRVICLGQTIQKMTQIVAGMISEAQARRMLGVWPGCLHFLDVGSLRTSTGMQHGPHWSSNTQSTVRSDSTWLRCSFSIEPGYWSGVLRTAVNSAQLLHRMC